MTDRELIAVLRRLRVQTGSLVCVGRVNMGDIRETVKDEVKVVFTTER